MSEHNADRSRQAILRALAAPRPPGPDPARRLPCPEPDCGQMIAPWPKAQRDHAAAHERHRAAARRRKRKHDQEHAAARLEHGRQAIQLPACPECGAAAGKACRRPSGHTCDPHRARVDAAAADLERHPDAHPDGGLWVRLAGGNVEPVPCQKCGEQLARDGSCYASGCYRPDRPNPKDQEGEQLTL